MRHDNHNSANIYDRINSIPMSAHKRRAAVIDMQRAERIASALFGAVSLGRRGLAAMVRALRRDSQGIVQTIGPQFPGNDARTVAQHSGRNP